MIAESGLNASLRSHEELPTATTDIYVADTMGELGLFYRLAPIVFMGGSLVEHGGQNPIEAVKLGASVVHGPHVFNFSDVYEALDRAGGARKADSQEALVKQYCAGCHNDRLKSGGFSFAKLDLAHIDQNAEQAEKVITKLRSGMMPPAGMPRPDRTVLNNFASSMEYSITFLARGVWGSLPITTCSPPGPVWTIFSTSNRILRRSMSRFFKTLAATPDPSLTRPKRMCSVPMYS